MFTYLTLMQKKIILILALCFAGKAFAQIAPVSSRTTFRPPYSAQLSEWSEKVSLSLLLRDLSVANGSVFVRLHLESSRISMETSPSVFSRVFHLDGGVPLLIDGDELRDLFKPENLVFSGISASEFVRNGARLPEGSYKLWFEVFEWDSKLKVSAAEHFANIYLFDIEPPALNLPTNNSLMIAENPQRILFSWTPRHLHAQSNGFRGIYDLELVEIPEHYSGDPQILFETSQKMLEKSVFQTQFLCNEFSDVLIPNRRYAYRVRVRNSDETNMSFQLKNDGYSEFFAFQYVEKCQKIEFLQALPESPYSANITWMNADFKNQYLVSYRKKGDEKFSWFTKTVDHSGLLLNEFAPNQTYEVKVKTLCAFNHSEESEVVSFTTPALLDSAVQCGMRFIPSDTCVKPLEKLTDQDVFTSNGTTVYLSEVSGSNGVFSGKGYITIPSFQFVKVDVVFKNIRINACFEHTNGVIEAVSDKKKSL